MTYGGDFGPMECPYCERVPELNILVHMENCKKRPKKHSEGHNPPMSGHWE